MDCLTWLRDIFVDVWEIRKKDYNYDSDSGFGQQLHFQSSPGILAVVEGQRNGNFGQNDKFGQNGKLGHSCASDKGQALRLLCQRSCYCAFRFKCKQLHP